MSIRAKILLIIIPLVFLGIMFIGFWSSKIFTQYIYDNNRELSILYLDKVVHDNLEKRTDLLIATGLQNSEIYVSSYQQEALDSLDKESKKYNRYIYVVNKNAKLISKIKFSKMINAIFFKNLIKKAEQNTEFIKGDVVINNEKILYVAKYFQPWDWTIVVGISEKELLSIVYDINKTILITSFILAILVGLFVYLILYKLLIIPISKLEKASLKIAKNEPLKNIDITTNDEFLSLARSMENMYISIIKKTKSLQDSEEELQTINENLQQKKDELETIIQEAPNPIMIHNEDGKIIMVNKVWESLTGYKYEEIDTIEKWTYNAYAQRKPLIKEHIDKLYEIKTKIDEGEYNIITKNGSIIIWQFSSSPLGIIDNKRTVISSAMDITELKQKDEMLINQSRHAAMGEMIGMIAHQWRQPISTISMDANNMLLDIALDNLEVENAQEYAKNIIEQTNHLSHTIDDFRNFFKPDKTISKVNLKEVFDQTLTIVKDSLKNNNIEFKSDFQTQEKVNAYPRELMQVFVNIITNSKDAIVHNRVKNAFISAKIYEDKNNINVDICDNGGGINPDILSKVFDPYFSTKDEKTGTGLGLYMSKMIIEEHLSGKIEAYNHKDGACIRIRLLK